MRAYYEPLGSVDICKGESKMKQLRTKGLTATRMFFLSSFLTLLFGSNTAAPGNDWTMFRHDPARTGMSPGQSYFRLYKPDLFTAWIVEDQDNSVHAAPVATDYAMAGPGWEAEIVIGSISYQTVCLYEYNPPSYPPVWSQYSGSVEYSTPLLVDLEPLDGNPEVIVGTGLCLDGVGMDPPWSFPTNGSSFSSPLVITQNGSMILYIGDDYGILYRFGGITKSGWTDSKTLSTNSVIKSSASAGDLNGDQQPEIVFTTEDGAIYVLDTELNVLDILSNSYASYTTAALADTDMDGSLDIFVYDYYTGSLDCYGYDDVSGIAPRWTLAGLAANETDFPPSPGIGDLNGDKIPDIVIHDGEKVIAVEGQFGGLMWETEADSEHFLFGSPVLADLDSDSKLEIVITGGPGGSGPGGSDSDMKGRGNDGPDETGERDVVGILYFLQHDGSIQWIYGDDAVFPFSILNEAVLADVVPDPLDHLEIIAVDDCCYAAGLTQPADSLDTDIHEISEAAGGTVHFALAAGIDQAFRDYLLLGSISGTEPGILLPPGLVTLPLKWDLFTSVVLQNINGPFFEHFLGTLDDAGFASVEFYISAIPGMAGIKMYYAFALGNPWNFASNPVTIDIVP